MTGYVPSVALPKISLKKRVEKRERLRELLRRSDSEGAFEQEIHLPPRKLVNSLFSFLQSGDPVLKWSAVRIFGKVVANLAEEDPEAARVIMRRLMWSLNDESGGIGWGSPEAMGEILARHSGLAEEYVSILLSYAREDGNYLEHEGLQRGLLWGIGRVAEDHPLLVRESAPDLTAYLASPDASVRGLAARLMGILRVSASCPKLRELARDQENISIDFQNELGKHSVKELAEQALARVPCF
jgi:hypothetical protein